MPGERVLAWQGNAFAEVAISGLMHWLYGTDHPS